MSKASVWREIKSVKREIAAAKAAKPRQHPEPVCVVRGDVAMRLHFFKTFQREIESMQRRYAEYVELVPVLPMLAKVGAKVAKLASKKPKVPRVVVADVIVSGTKSAASHPVVVTVSA